MTGGEPTAPELRQRSPAWQQPFRFVGAILGKVFRDPVVHGRLRAIAWPPGLVVVVALAIIGYLVAMAIAVTGPLLRRVLPLEIAPGGGSAPGSVLFVILALLSFAVALFQVGALHAAWWIRILGLLVSGVVLTRFGGFGDQYGSAVQLAVLSGCFLVLVLLQIIRWRRRFVWWEVAVVLAVFGVAVLSAYQPVDYSRDMTTGAGTGFLYLIISQLNYLAGPVAMASGFAIAQLAFATVVWTVDLGRREMPGWVIKIALAALLSWRVYAEVRAMVVRPTLRIGMLVWPVALLITVGLGWYLLDRVADRRRPGTTRIADLSEDLKFLVYPVAVLILAPTLAFPMLSQPMEYVASVSDRAGWGIGTPLHLLGALISSVPTDSDIWGVLAAVLLLVFAVRAAWRGDRGRAELLLAITAVHVGTVFSSTLFSTTFLGAWMIAGVLVVSLVLLVRRRLTARRVEGLLVLTGVATVASTRDLFADPFEVLLGGSAAVLLGLVWALLVGGDDANGDSRMLPRSARVCLLFANSLFGMAVLAFAKISSQMPEVTGALDLMNASGDALLGGGLLLGAAVAIFGQLWRNDELSAGGDLSALQVYGR